MEIDLTSVTVVPQAAVLARAVCVLWVTESSMLWVTLEPLLEEGGPVVRYRPLTVTCLVQAAMVEMEE
jgi:hypothetical protein